MLFRSRYLERPFLIFFLAAFAFMLYCFHTGSLRLSSAHSEAVYGIQRTKPAGPAGVPEDANEDLLFGSPGRQGTAVHQGAPGLNYDDTDQPPQYDGPGSSPDYDVQGDGSKTSSSPPTAVSDLPILHETYHPIDDLIESAQREFGRLIKQKTKGVNAAAVAYRERRGRHPPPGFKQWVDILEQNGGTLVESFFDQIYEDLEPFWGVPPAELRDAPLKHNSGLTLEISEGKESWRSDRDATHFTRFQNIDDIIQFTKVLFPDSRMMFNMETSSNVFVPWEEMQRLLQIANGTKSTAPPGPRNPLKQQYQTISKLPDMDSQYDYGQGRPFPSFQDRLREANQGDFWSYARLTCPPDSPARDTSYDANFTAPPTFPSGTPPGSYSGFVSNWKTATSPCEQPHLRNLHGGLIAPVDQAVSTELVPIFSPLKIRGMSNDILIPGPEYLTDNAMFEMTKLSRAKWEDKRNRVFWRGSGVSSDRDAANWRHLHRQRLVSMLNGTQVYLTENKLASTGAQLTTENYDTAAPALPHNFPLHNATVYPLDHIDAVKSSKVHRSPQQSIDNNAFPVVPMPSTYRVDPADDETSNAPPSAPGPVENHSSTSARSPLSLWLEDHARASFTDLSCSNGGETSGGANASCAHMEEFFRTEPSVPFREILQNRYLPDVDGTSYSTRFRTYLESMSVPIKSTIYAEWHDARLVPWVHFVPMDNTYADLYGILDYFQYNEAREKLAKMIARQGSQWAGRVLREQDMAMYMYRLILEYGRLLNDDREQLAWVDDLR